MPNGIVDAIWKCSHFYMHSFVRRRRRREGQADKNGIQKANTHLTSDPWKWSEKDDDDDDDYNGEFKKKAKRKEKFYFHCVGIKFCVGVVAAAAAGATLLLLHYSCAVYFIKSDHVRFVIFLVVCNFCVAGNISHFTFRPKNPPSRHALLHTSLHTWNNIPNTLWMCEYCWCDCLSSKSFQMHLVLNFFSLPFLLRLLSVPWPSIQPLSSKVNVGPLRVLRSCLKGGNVKHPFWSSESLRSLPPMWLHYFRFQNTRAHKLNALMLLWKSQIGLGGRIRILLYSMFCLLFDMSNFSVYGICALHSEWCRAQIAHERITLGYSMYSITLCICVSVHVVAISICFAALFVRLVSITVIISMFVDLFGLQKSGFSPATTLNI